MTAPAPLFLGLTRPARFAGLPVAYFALWGGGSTILFLLVETVFVAVPSALVYLALRTVSEREPHFFEILRVAATRTPRTPNRARWGGDSYSVSR